MPKSSKHNEWLPPQALKALSELGENLALARVRRRESLLDWAQRLRVSARTVQRLEAGDAGVGMGVYAAALWLIGRTDALASLADPALDRGALELDMRAASDRLARRRGGVSEFLCSRRFVEFVFAWCSLNKRAQPGRRRRPRLGHVFHGQP